MNDTNLAVEVEALRRRLEQVEHERAAERQARSRRRRRAAVVLALATAVSAGVALAASPPCMNGIPFCFQVNQPAMADEVNANFAALKTWLEAKVGATGTLGAPSSAISTSSVAATGALSVGGSTLLSGPATLSSGLSVTGSTTLGSASSSTDFLFFNGYSLTCAGGEMNASNAFCCRTNTRNGETRCSRTADSGGTWTSMGAIFDPTVSGRYSVSCAKWVAGVNFPICCRIDANTGATSCKVTSAAGPYTYSPTTTQPTF